MGRYMPLLFISFLLVVLIITGTSLLAGFADKQQPDAMNSIRIYTSLPVEQVDILAQAYERSTGVKLVIVPFASTEILAKVALNSGTENAADLILTSQQLLQKAQKDKLLTIYNSEQTDVIPERFSEEDGYWVGVWYDPIVIVMNKDFLKSLKEVPSQWSDLENFNYRLVVTDFLTADAAANLLYSLEQEKGEPQTLSLLTNLHMRTVQYAKFLSTPPRMVGMGEADIAIAVQSETLRYVHDGFPLQIIYPIDGTAYLLTGIGLTASAVHESEAKRFIDWIIQDDAQAALQINRFYFISTNPSTKSYKEYNGKNITLFDYQDKLSDEEKSKILDKWVQTIRFSPR